MKTTIFGVLLDVTPEQDTVLHQLMRKYGFMLRFAFNRLLGGLSKIGALERPLSSDTELALRYDKGCGARGPGSRPNPPQGDERRAGALDRTREKTQELLTSLRKNHPHSRRMAVLERKLAHQAALQVCYQQHVDAHTFSPVVFGTKKRWLDRFKTLDDPGDRTKNCRFRSTLPARCPRKQGNATIVTTKACSAMSGDPYQVELLRRHGRYQVRITVEESRHPFRPIRNMVGSVWIPTAPFWPSAACCPTAIPKRSRLLANHGSTMSGRPNAMRWWDTLRGRRSNGRRNAVRAWLWKICSSSMTGMGAPSLTA
ncbi:MAG: hypothetical protein M1499_06320 [Firmicutes bacterium]|nr:hypothetical protein [Bacillota bacterium]